MARFKYMGEQGSFLTSVGPCLKIMVPLKDGTQLTLVAPNQTTGFPIGQDVGYDFTDERSIRYLRADTRFQLI